MVVSVSTVVSASTHNCPHPYTDESYQDTRGGLGAILFNDNGFLLCWFSELTNDNRVSSLKVNQKKASSMNWKLQPR